MLGNELIAVIIHSKYFPNAFQTKMCFSKLQNSVRKPNFPRQKKHDFRQKVNNMTAWLQEARVIPSKYNGVAVVEITHIYSE